MSSDFEDSRDAMSLISRYARSIDASDTQLALGCLTDDVTLSLDGGKRVVTGLVNTEIFFHDLHVAKRIPSTHLISNYGVERIGPSVVVHCSAIVCSCRKEGFVTMRGAVYAVTCVRVGSDLRIQKLQHESTWESNAPGGLSTMSWLSQSASSPTN